MHRNVKQGRGYGYLFSSATMEILYFKQLQQEERWKYIKLYADRCPPALEVLNFINHKPVLDFHEFDLGDPSSRIEYKTLCESAISIKKDEYQQAYGRAT